MLQIRPTVTVLDSNNMIRHAGERQQERTDDPRTVLSERAVDQDRRLLIGKNAEQHLSNDAGLGLQGLEVLFRNRLEGRQSDHGFFLHLYTSKVEEEKTDEIACITVALVFLGLSVKI